MLLYIVIALAFLGLYLFALIDAIRTPEAVWREAGRNKTLWVVVLALGSCAASVVYLLMTRRVLRDTAKDMPAAPQPRPQSPAVAIGPLRRCEHCGFATVDAAATSCRSCGQPLSEE